jgi:hypothetical protein
VLRFLFALLLPGALVYGAAPTAADISRQIQDAGLDPAECYRVIDFNFAKEDLRVYLTSGYLMFSKPVNGVRTGAVFIADVEGGDAEILLLPPTRSERLSLANFTESPNLDEHFHSALMVFSDKTGEELTAELQAAGAKKAPEMGTILAEKWSTPLKNLAASFLTAMTGDVLTPRRNGFFYMTVGGLKLGTFDVFYDPKADENILVGKTSDHKGANIFDVWTTFGSKSRRQGGAPERPDLKLDNYRIEATVQPDLRMLATTRVTGTLQRAGGRAVRLAISRQMRVIDAKVDGKPAEVFQRESIQSNLLQDNGNEYFLVVTPEELEPGKPHEFEIRHEGAVITRAGDQVFFVSARGFWYPRSGLDFARYELTFRCPKELGFVANGDTVEDRVDGDWRVTKRVIASPIRFAGFNLGNYASFSVAHDPFKVIVYANKNLESALIPAKGAPAPPEPFSRRRSAIDSVTPPLPPLPPDPAARLKTLANDIAGAMDFMAGLLGPPPVKTITVSPIPGGFGQGFPGLLYLSTLAYLDPAQRPRSMQGRYSQTFFSEMLDAHEVAHQWWGNLVTTSSYEDGWLTEALSNYTALLYLEKKKGPKALDAVLDDYRAHLLAKGENGKTAESAGPITWGYRLQSSLSPDSWHSITYEKGAWVLHMLRRKMGDDRFLAMLRALCERYRFQSVTTAQFRKLAQEFGAPQTSAGDMESFFENWVYGTGIPTIQLNYTVRGLKVTGTVTQSDVADDFTARIPIEVQSGRTRNLYWVPTSNDTDPFEFTLKEPAVKVGLAVKDALMSAKK